MKKTVIAFMLILISAYSYSQEIIEKPVTYEEWETIVDIAFTGEVPEKALYRYDVFKSEIKIGNKKLPKCLFMRVLQGNGSVDISMATEGYSNSFNIVVEKMDRPKKVRFHYQYDCIIKYYLEGQEKPIYRRGILMSRFDLDALSRGNLRPLHKGESEYYKIIDLAIYTAEQDVIIQIDKLKND